MDNIEIAKVFYEIAEYLELQGIAFKPKAYERAASTIEGLDRDINELYREKALRGIPGIGEAIEEKIIELIETGKLRYLEKLRGEVPPGLLKLLEVPDIGPKKAMLLFNELGIYSIEELKKAVFDHRLQGIKGFGPKTEDKILQGIRVVESRAGRALLGHAYLTAESMTRYLKEKHPDARISIAGSLRRMKETIGDIDILVATSQPSAVMESFVSNGSVKEIMAKGETKSSVRTSSGIQVDLRAIPFESYGAALQYFTGSKEHNVELRKIAISKGLKSSEYGLFDRATDRRIASEREEDIYGALGMQFIPPELRENRGELDAAGRNSLPKLIEYGDLKGDLHCHTEWSDAADKIEDMWEKAKELNYEYLAITDHSQSLRIGSGLSEERLLQQVSRIRKLRDSAEGPYLLAGSEVDLLADGKLDYPKKILDELDFAVMSIHSRFKMEEKEMTERIIAGLGNEKIKIFGHPTGRIIGQRQEYSFDFDEVLDAAKRHGVAMEVNCYPDRLDLNDLNVRRTIDAGVMISIDTDAHQQSDMENVKYGIATARRGWAKEEDVLNTRPLKRLKKEWGI